MVSTASTAGLNTVGSSIAYGASKAGLINPLLLLCYLLRFEPQLLSDRLPVKVDVLRADLIAFNLREGSQRIGDFATGRRRTVHKRARVGAV
jgi:hypothetical protein